jgi:hypothetical protein
MECAKELGLAFDDEDLVVLATMATTDAVIRSRYIQIGFFIWPSKKRSIGRAGAYAQASAQRLSKGDSCPNLVLYTRKPRTGG